MLFPTKVRLQESDHKYYDEKDEEYLSFSSIFSFISHEFDAKKMAYFAGGKNEEGMIAKLDEWDAKRQAGVDLDNALTEYGQTGKVTNPDLLDAVKYILSDYPKHTFEQVVVYDEYYRSAGTADKVVMSSNRKDSKFMVSDFKCYESFDLTNYRSKWLKAPFEHLPNNKLTKINFQLSFYAYHIEKLTGKKCEGTFIHLIDPTTIGGEIKQQKVHLPYIKNDIIILLETFKDQIKEKLTNKNEFII